MLQLSGLSGQPAPNLHLILQWYHALNMMEGFGMLLSSVYSVSRQLLHSESGTQWLQSVDPQETSS